MATTSNAAARPLAFPNCTVYLWEVPYVSVPAFSRSNDSSAGSMKKLAKRIWNEAKPMMPGDEVDRYLRHRGLVLPDYPKALRFHAALGYYEKDDAGTSRKMAEY